MKINKLIDHHKLEFDNFYKRILETKLDKSILAKAMKYSSIKGGKRITKDSEWIFIQDSSDEELL